MEAFDEYALKLLEQAKRFLEKASSETVVEGKEAYLNCALLVGICSLEALVNGIIEDIADSKGFETYEKALLKEKELFLKGGEFLIGERLKMTRIIDKIEIIYFKYKKNKIDFRKQEWANLKLGIDTRNKLVHPKSNVTLTVRMVESVLRAVISCVDELFLAVYRRGYPRKKKGLQSELTFE